MTISLAEGAVSYSTDQARQAIGGYAFATRALNLRTMHASVGPGPIDVRAATWAYATYDQQPSDPGPLSYFDIIATIGLSSQIKVPAIQGMLAIAPDVNEALARVPVHQTFWDLPPAQMVDLPEGTSAWWMWRAEQLLDSVPAVGTTIAYKTLHHKRPWQFPLLDNETMKVLQHDTSWALIHHDLTSQVEEFEHLETWFANEAASRGGVAILRLRMHDILVWLDVVGDRTEAIKAGALLGF